MTSDTASKWRRRHRRQPQLPYRRNPSLTATAIRQAIDGAVGAVDAVGPAEAAEASSKAANDRKCLSSTRDHGIGIATDAPQETGSGRDRGHLKAVANRLA